MKVSPAQILCLLLISLSLSACNPPEGTQRDRAPKVTVAPVQPQPITLTQRYLCQIQSHHHIVVRAPETGILRSSQVKDGATVKHGDVLFQIEPSVSQGQRRPENEDKVASVRAPFDGIVDRLSHQQGSLIQIGETLTTLSDNHLMWAYFNVPESRYLQFKADNLDQHKDDLKIELMLANGKKFDQLGKLGAIGADFNAETSSVRFRADFPNPEQLLRHGQSGVLLISHVQNDAIAIPQRATFEVRQKRFVYVVDKDNVASQREIEVQKEFEDQFVVESGLSSDEKIVVEGINLVRDGEKVAFEKKLFKNAAEEIKERGKY